MKITFAPGFAESLKRCFRSPWHPRELWYKFKCWAWRRHTTVKPRSLAHTWCDRCDLLAHVMFEILGQFIEEECSPGCVEWYGGSPHTVDVDGVSKNVRDEMQDLWDWWNTVYLHGYDARRDVICDQIDKIGTTAQISLLDLFDKSLTGEAKDRVRALYRQLTALEDEERKELNARLHRLLNIREYMWT